MSLFIQIFVNSRFTISTTITPITRKMAVTGSCCACFVTITSTQSTPKRISMAPPLSRVRMRKKTWVSPRLTPCRSQGDDGQEEVISTASLPIPAVWALIFLKHFIKYPFRQICLAAILNITLFLLHPYDVTPRSPLDLCYQYTILYINTVFINGDHNAVFHPTPAIPERADHVCTV